MRTDLRQRILDTRLLPGQIAVFFLGQEGFLIRSGDMFLLIDGYLTDYVDRHSSVTQVTWKRSYPSPIAPEALDFVDYVFCTHEHDDHADPDTLSVLGRINQKAKFIAPAPIVPMICGFGVDESRIIPALADEKIALPGLSILPVPAAHEQLLPDSLGRHRALGYRIALAGVELFHAGDCCLYEGLEERLRGTDILFLPVNGRDYYRLQAGIIGNMDAREAALLAARVGAKLLVPMHIGLYDVNDVPLPFVVDQITRFAPGIPFHIFQPGERMIYSKS